MPHRLGGQWVAVRSGRRAWRQVRRRGSALTWRGLGEGQAPARVTEGAGQVWMGGGSVCPPPREA